MSKVVLPKNVAEAIESQKSSGYSNQQILTFPYSNDYPSDCYRDVIQRYRIDEFDNLMGALVNGYDTEKTPHEKLLDYYLGLIKSEDQLESNNQSGSQFRQGWKSVEDTLEILDITVEGINDI